MQITRVVELELRGFTPTKLFPVGWSDASLSEANEGLSAWAISDVREHLLISVHTCVIHDQGRTILVDTGVGNDKDRPYAPYFDHLQSRYSSGYVQQARPRKMLTSC